MTNNTDHFARIPNLPLENWLERPIHHLDGLLLVLLEMNYR